MSESVVKHWRTGQLVDSAVSWREREGSYHSASTASIMCVSRSDSIRTTKSSFAVMVIVPSDDCAFEFK